MRPTVMIVDDDPDVGTSVGQLFEHRGHAVVVVNSAYQAMALLPGCAVGVVLCDVQMPGMSGIELLVALGNHPGLPPFILWTGGPSAECEQSALAAGARAFLAKPAESQRLFQLVDDLVGADAPR